MSFFFLFFFFFFSFSSTISDLPLWCWGETAGNKTNEGDSKILFRTTAAFESGINPRGVEEGAKGSMVGCAELLAVPQLHVPGCIS